MSYDSGLFNSAVARGSALEYRCDGGAGFGYLPGIGDLVYNALIDRLPGKEGYTLAAAMLFGTDRTIHMVAPFYKIDALCRRYNTDLYDNRDMMACNLLRALDRLTKFCEINIPEWPFIEGVQRISLRDVIFREICLNLLIHSEYGSRHSSTFTIWADRVEIINWNIPYGYGQVTLENFHPYAKNPVIANFSLQLGIVEEVGKGTRTLFKYVPLISGGQKPVIEEKDEFKVTVPYLMAGPAAETTEKTTEKPAEAREITREKTRVKTREKILALIRSNNEISEEELADAVDITIKGVEWQLNNLKKIGKLKRIGPDNGGHWEVIE